MRRCRDKPSFAIPGDIYRALNEHLLARAAVEEGLTGALDEGVHAPAPIRMQPRRWISRPRVVSVALGFALAVGGAVTALGFYYLGPSPGFNVALSSFDRLPVAERPASIPEGGLDRAGAQVGLEPGEAASRLRRLRVGLPTVTFTRFAASAEVSASG